MDDGELFKYLQGEADAGNIRNITYTVIPRGKHKITIKSSKLEKMDDTSRFLEIIGTVTDESPENGIDFKIRQMLLTKDGKKIAQGMALAAGVIVAAKACSVTLNANFTGSTGTSAECWLDVDSYTKDGKTYFNQQVHWGTEEPPKTSKAAAVSTASPTGDQPPF